MADEGKDPTGQESGLRTGGNMQTRGGAKVTATQPPSEGAGTRTGGNMQTRSGGGGPSGGQSTDRPAEETSETPAGQSE